MRWRGVCGSKSAPIQGEHELFGFLTTEANAAVARVHPKAMPLILRRPGEFDLWLEGDLLDALMLPLLPASACGSTAGGVVAVVEPGRCSARRRQSELLRSSRRRAELGSGLIDQSQKATAAAMQIAEK
jgi:hypothetical protein